jgi:hypothetical protein
LYAPSELLEQVEKQVKAQFNGEITGFEWWHEEEYTTIAVTIQQIALQIPVIRSTRQIIDSICSDQYIVALLVRPIESISESKGLFNLIYDGAGNVFSLDYYAPERSGLSCPEGTNPFTAPIYYTPKFSAISTIHLDSPVEFWKRLFDPINEVLAKKAGVHSFSKETLAEELQYFLLKHLDFITHIAEAKGKQLQILAPQSIPLHQPSNGTEPNRTPRQKHRAREERKGARQKQVRRQPALAA